MKQHVKCDEVDIGYRFGLNQFLTAITVLSVPIAFITGYWGSVTNTVDERTIPFSNAGLLRQSYLIAGLLVLVAITGVFVFIVLRRRLYFIAGVFVLACVVGVSPLFRQIESKIIAPPQGNKTAEIHNDAAAIAAIAVDRYFSRTKQWPRSWEDLDQDLAGVIAEIKERMSRSAVPFGTPSSISSDTTTTEETQSIFYRSPDLAAMTALGFRKLVEIDFEADPKALAKMNWVEFSGIVPHKPAYNTYRVEFSKLIARLDESSGRSEEIQKSVK